MYESAYSAHPLVGVPGHRVRVTAFPDDPTREWELTFDGNLATLDAFGDVRFSTLIYFFPWQMSLDLLDQRGHKKLFAIDAHRQGVAPDEASEVTLEGPPLRLVTVTKPQHEFPEIMRLLVLDDQENIVNVIDLPRRS